MEREEKGKLVEIKAQQPMLVCVAVIVAPALTLHLLLQEVVSPVALVVVVVPSSDPVMLLYTLLL